MADFNPTEGAAPLPPHWRRVLDAAKRAEPAAAHAMENSETAERAAAALASPCVVVISVNRAAGTFEARCAGKNEAWFDMARQIADAALAGIDKAEP